MPPPCSFCAAPAAPLACARCKCAFYCGAACQRAAWGAHKGGCVAGAAAALPTMVRWSEPQCCSTCGSDGVRQRCLGCKCASYCDEQCQRAAWGAHRDACRAAAAAPKVENASEQSHCSQCGCETPIHRKMCGRCATVLYCGEACARAHWKGGHRDACAAAGAALFSSVRAHAEAGSFDAMFYCGLYYGNGVGVAVDAAAAVKWYTRAAEVGSARAQYNLGLIYHDGGTGVAADAAAAVTWFARASDAGNIQAMNSLAIYYSEGKGVAVDIANALFTRAAEAGNAVAQCNLGEHYLSGKRGVAHDVAKAREWYSRAAAGGHAIAYAKLAALDAAAPL